jgi:hypothetical protein
LTASLRGKGTSAVAAEVISHTRAHYEHAKPEWERHEQPQGRSSAAARGGKRYQTPALIVGGLVLAGLGLWLGFRPSSDSSRPQAVAPVQAQRHAAEPAEAPVESAAPSPEKAAESFLKEAEPIARRFLNATTVAEALRDVRLPERAGKRMERMFPGGTIGRVGLSAFPTEPDKVALGGDAALVQVVTREGETRGLTFVRTPGGWKIDWESWAGWSDLPWEEFSPSGRPNPCACGSRRRRSNITISSSATRRSGAACVSNRPTASIFFMATSDAIRR